jgi:hypothetical protein
MFSLNFETSGTDFDPSTGGISRGIVDRLRDLADRIERAGIEYNDPRHVQDTNGNHIGEFRLSRPGDPELETLRELLDYSTE